MLTCVQEPYWQPNVNLPKRQQWVSEAMTATSGSSNPVEQKYGNAGGALSWSQRTASALLQLAAKACAPASVAAMAGVLHLQL